MRLRGIDQGFNLRHVLLVICQGNQRPKRLVSTADIQDRDHWIRLQTRNLASRVSNSEARFCLPRNGAVSLSEVKNSTSTKFEQALRAGREGEIQHPSSPARQTDVGSTRS